MSDERIPDDIMRDAEDEATQFARPGTLLHADMTFVIARKVFAERNRVHKQLKGEGE